MVRYIGLVWSNIAEPFFYHPIYMILVLHPLIIIFSSCQTPKRDDDIIVKLPIVILFGEEKDWEVEERERMIGDGDIFGKNATTDF